MTKAEPGVVHAQSAAVPSEPESGCPFCHRITEPSDLPRSDQAAVIWDAFPRAQGHLLVVPHTHIANYFELPGDVKSELWALVDSARSYLYEQYQPAGWTIRINVTKAAGQTVDHAHIHVLPHYHYEHSENSNQALKGV